MCGRRNEDVSAQGRKQHRERRDKGKFLKPSSEGGRVLKHSQLLYFLAASHVETLQGYQILAVMEWDAHGAGRGEKQLVALSFGSRSRATQDG